MKSATQFVSQVLPSSADAACSQCGESVSVRNVNLLTRMAAAFTQSKYDVHYAAYANVLFGSAGLVLLTEAFVTWAIAARISSWWLFSHERCSQ